MPVFQPQLIDTAENNTTKAPVKQSLDIENEISDISSEVPRSNENGMLLLLLILQKEILFENGANCTSNKSSSI